MKILVVKVQPNDFIDIPEHATYTFKDGVWMVSWYDSKLNIECYVSRNIAGIYECLYPSTYKLLKVTWGYKNYKDETTEGIDNAISHYREKHFQKNKDNTMTSAKKARAITEEYINKIDSIKMSVIDNLILSEANNGKTGISYTGTLADAEIKRLKDLGYDVSSIRFNEWVISWGNA